MRPRVRHWTVGRVPPPADRPDVRAPEPPGLLSPWHTPARAALQEQARRFAMDEVLPVANELDPQKGEMPAALLERMGELGWFGITIPAEERRPGARRVRVLHGQPRSWPGRG